jgi:hypothetical protein
MSKDGSRADANPLSAFVLMIGGAMGAALPMTILIIWVCSWLCSRPDSAGLGSSGSSPRNSPETVLPTSRQSAEANHCHDLAGAADGVQQMTVLAQAFTRFSTNSNPETETLKMLAVLCGARLLISIVLAACGLDLGVEYFWEKPFSWTDEVIVK